MSADLTDLLAEMDGRRGEDHVLDDLTSLIRAVRAALARHQMQPGVFPPQCWSCGSWDDETDEFTGEIWPCPTVQAITAELTRKAGTDGN